MHACMHTTQLPLVHALPVQIHTCRTISEDFDHTDAPLHIFCMPQHHICTSSHISPHRPFLAINHEPLHKRACMTHTHNIQRLFHCAPSIPMDPCTSII